MSELFDFDWDTPEDFRPSFTARPAARHAPAFNPLDCYTDDELLRLPGDTIANVLRETSVRGRDYVVGDISPSNWSVVRVPDSEATMEDFQPHLDWNDSNEVAMEPQGRYPVNLNLASRAIAPRIAEPHLPAQTRISGHALNDADVPLPPVERTLLKAAQAIQLVRKADGDYKAVAQALGRVWGDEALFDPEESLDLLGDLSLPRVLARTGKRRFETYRNIGFTSIVSAGVNQATSKGYGDSAVINWQRRTELAKYFLHMAIVLEGHNLEVGSRFGITVRIPFSSVVHRTWADIGVECDPSYITTNAVTTQMLRRARNFVRMGLRSALRIVSTAVRATGMDIDWGDADTIVASGFDRLIYRDSLRPALELPIPDHELSGSSRHDREINVHGSFKAHDPRVAVLELMEASGFHHSEAHHVVALLQHARKLVGKYARANRVTVTRSLARECGALYPYARAVTSRPITYEDRHTKAEWSRIARQQLPPDLIVKDDAYHPMTLIHGMIYAILYDPSTQVARTLAYHATMLNKQLDLGIRGKQSVIQAHGKGVEHTVRKDMLTATRSFYRDRYRRRGMAAQIVRAGAEDVASRDALTAWAAREFARADAAFKTNLGYDDGKPNIRLPDKRRRAVMALLAYHLRPLGFPDPPKFIEMTVPEVDEWMQEMYLLHLPNAPPECSPQEIMAAHQRFMDAHQADHDAVSKPVEIHEHAQEDVEATATHFDDLLAEREINTATTNSVDDMVSYWIAMAGDYVYFDEDEADEFSDWLTENIETHVQNVPSYVATHSDGESKRSAADLIEFWLDLKEMDDEAMGGTREIA